MALLDYDCDIVGECDHLYAGPGQFLQQVVQADFPDKRRGCTALWAADLHLSYDFPAAVLVHHRSIDQELFDCVDGVPVDCASSPDWQLRVFSSECRMQR